MCLLKNININQSTSNILDLLLIDYEYKPCSLESLNGLLAVVVDDPGQDGQSQDSQEGEGDDEREL